ncbi:MAG: CRISPR-associated helicase Cas3' [Defluviitaleaceae bacterium]|nr:CRISPR-associated helicase Cas3' [Defluviitaleaceae bacterium]
MKNLPSKYKGNYIARTRADNEQQPLSEHLLEVAKLAATNAATWGEDFAHVCGLLHDIGKYSDKFQDRVRGAAKKADHATAGAQLLCKSSTTLFRAMAAYCIMGHHGGLPNGGTRQRDEDGPNMYDRLIKTLDDYTAYSAEIEIPQLKRPTKYTKDWDGFHLSFFIRMVFSALVDADRLNSEKFGNMGNLKRGGFATIPELHTRLQAKVQNYLQPPKEVNQLNAHRTSLLKNCLTAAEKTPGLFTLSAPTGSGKTINSLAFALNHAVKNGLRRIIYVIPYNTIIEQNAAVFEDILGIENVLRHNSEARYESDENDDNEIAQNKQNSTENWDYPLIVTSNVQFLESIFSNKTSKCRKLHNITNSVIIFDEAQMIPVSYLKPCVKAIETLVTQYGCTAVLSTATPSALDYYFKSITVSEIAEDPKGLYKALQRTKLVPLHEPLNDDVLLMKLLEQQQVLCIVNTRKHAQVLYTAIQKAEPDGTFHLSTTMYPGHRRSVLDTIRERLKAGFPCRVISTSLVEAGVDLDFVCVYRAQAGLDSIVQAAGRCNRENKRSQEESPVYIFESAEHKPPEMIKLNIATYGQISREYENLSDIGAVKAYFERLFDNLGPGKLDVKSIEERLNKGQKTISFPFKDIAEDFKLIEEASQTAIYVLHHAPELEARVRSGERSRELFRELGAYAVSLYEYELKWLLEVGAVWRECEKNASIWLLSRDYYDENMGVTLSPEGGMGLFDR